MYFFQPPPKKKQKTKNNPKILISIEFQTKVENAEISKIIEDKIDQFCNSIKQNFDAKKQQPANDSKKKPAGPSLQSQQQQQQQQQQLPGAIEHKKNEITISFFIKTRENGYIFGTREKKDEWEKWILPLDITNVNPNPNAIPSDEKNRTTETIRFILSQVIQKIDAKRDSIPAISWANENGCFPFDINFGQAQESRSIQNWFFNTPKPSLI